ncbi:hypothetical protein [Streptomyces himalayensis]|nr:hypothetical protein [Streptomyces himalayensis]
MSHDYDWAVDELQLSQHCLRVAQHPGTPTGARQINRPNPPASA